MKKNPKDSSSDLFNFAFYIYSTELMRRMKRYQIANYKCLVVKYSKDVRYDEEGIATHDRYGIGIYSVYIII